MMTAQQRSNGLDRVKLNRLKEAVDAEHLMRTLGFSISNTSRKEVRSPCLIHGGDNKTAFRMNKESKNWICFSHNCHDDIGYDVLSLVQRVLGINFSEAVKYLENMTGININDAKSYLTYQREKERRNFIMHNRVNVPPALVSEEYLRGFQKFRSPYFEGKGFPPDVLNEFEVGGGYVDAYRYQRDVIPIRDRNGILVAYSCRDISDRANYDFKYILTEDFDKDKCLYNLHRAKNHMGDNRTLIVVEGFKSVWKLYMAGYKNAVACMGSIITNGQQNILYSTAFNVVTLFDADIPGIKGTRKAVLEMGRKLNVKPLFLPYEDKDPADCTLEQLNEILGGV